MYCGRSTLFLLLEQRPRRLISQSKRTWLKEQPKLTVKKALSQRIILSLKISYFAAVSSGIGEVYVENSFRYLVHRHLKTMSFTQNPFSTT